MARTEKTVMVDLTVVKDGVEWVGRTSSASADIEMRFRDAGELPLGRRALAGTLRGQAPDMAFAPPLIVPRDVSVTIAGTAATGALMDAQTLDPYSVSTMVGRAVGDFLFRDSAGNVARCPAVTVFIGAPGPS